MNDHPTSHAAEGDNAFVDRLRAIPGAVSKAPAAKSDTSSASAPPVPAGDAGALAQRLAAIPGATRAAPIGGAKPAPDTPFGPAVEIPPPVATTRAAGPIVRHFRVLEPKMQRRAIGTVTRRPGTAA